MKKINKKQKNILFIIFILIILLIIINLIISNIKKETYGEYEVVGKDFTEEVNSLSISNFSILEEFENSSNSKAISVAKKIRDFFTIEIPEIKNNIEKYDSYTKYYEAISDSIKEDYFEIDEESFIKLCDKINSMTSNLSCDYVVCSFSLDNSNNDILIITCSYENGEEIVLEMTKKSIVSFSK
jgi:hypothetical protein